MNAWRCLRSHLCGELLGGFDLCDKLPRSDGGKMHLAAALNRDIVVFFGDTDKESWHPWFGRYHILHNESGDCVDVSIDEVWQKMQYFDQLKNKAGYSLPYFISLEPDIAGK